MGSQIINWVGVAASFITSCGVIISFIKKILNESLEPIKKELEEQKKFNEEIAIGEYKNYIVNFVNDVLHDEPISLAQIQRYYEVRDKYYAAGGNSYIHSACDSIEEKVKELWEKKAQKATYIK